MAELLLNDLLRFKKEDFGQIKIKFNQWNGYNDPMELYQSNPDIINNQWLFWRTQKRYFREGQTEVCLLKLTEDAWLLTTIKKVTKELGVYDGINYEGEELEKFMPYFGRVILKFHKIFVSHGRYYGESCDDFPGYDKVRMSFQKLETILNRGKRD